MKLKYFVIPHLAKCLSLHNFVILFKGKGTSQEWSGIKNKGAIGEETTRDVSGKHCNFLML